MMHLDVTKTRRFLAWLGLLTLGKDDAKAMAQMRERAAKHRAELERAKEASLLAAVSAPSTPPASSSSSSSPASSSPPLTPTVNSVVLTPLQEEQVHALR